MNALDTIKTHGCWPREKPAVPPCSQGWLAPGTARMLAKHLSPSTKLVLELGAWLGRSTRFILKKAPNAHVVTVDSWDDNVIRPWITSRHPRLLPVVEAGVRETFIVNQWGWRERLTPLQMHAHAAIDLVRSSAAVPDVVFLDTSHGYVSTLDEVTRITTAFPTTLLVGDDWEWQSARSQRRAGADWGCPVARAVQDFVQAHPDWGFASDGNGWEMGRVA